MSAQPPLPSALALCLPRLHGGGTEKIVARMAAWWASRGVHVWAVTFRAFPEDLPLHPAVRRIQIDSMAAEAPPLAIWPQEARNIPALRKVFSTLLERERISRLPVISFLARMNMRCLLAARGLPCRTIISERTYPPAVFLGEHDEALRRQLYPTADALVVQCEYTRQHWGSAIMGEERCHVLPNPLFPSSAPAARPEDMPREQPYFLAVGRLAPVKRHDLLLRAFAQLVPSRPDLHLYIAGSGQQEQLLHALRQDLGLERHATFLGQVQDVRPWLQGALALVHPSDYEGFPNVLLEALAEGCPIIATDCPTGPAEIVQQGINGFLTPVNDQNALAQAMRTMLDAGVQTRLRARMDRLPEKFSEERIMRGWSALLQERG